MFQFQSRLGEVYPVRIIGETYGQLPHFYERGSELQVRLGKIPALFLEYLQKSAQLGFNIKSSNDNY